MKYSVIIACISFLALTNCSLDSVNNTQPQTTRILWHLNNVSGGPENVDIDYPANKIIWEFKETTIEVTNTNTDTSLQDGLDTGIYTYEVKNEGGIEYLKINSVEVGKATFTSNGAVLTINQNEKSTGTVTDGYIFTFDKVQIVVN
jgi:hypothetical protein